MPSINLLPWRQELRKRRQREFAIGAVAALALALIIALLGRFTVDSMISAQQRVMLSGLRAWSAAPQRGQVAW